MTNVTPYTRTVAPTWLSAPDPLFKLEEIPVSFSAERYKDLNIPDHLNIAQARIGSGATIEDRVRMARELEDMQPRLKSTLKSLGYFGRTRAYPNGAPWCGLGMAYDMAKKYGHQIPANFASALAWRHFGKAVSMITPPGGAVAVFAKGNGGRGHVGKYLGETIEKGVRMIAVLGDNQAGKKSIQFLPASQLVAMRMPIGEEVAQLSAPIQYDRKQANIDFSNGAIYSKEITPLDVMKRRLERGLETEKSVADYKAKNNLS